MSDALRKDWPSEAETSQAPEHPQVFARAIVTPPAPPWEQMRAATLEAQHGAPLPLPELVHRIKRLARWAPGRPGRFAVFYVRSKEFRAPFETTVDVDGQSVKVAFGLGGEQVRRARGWAAVLGLLVLTGAVLGTAATLAFRARDEAEIRLESAEKVGSRKLASAMHYQAQIAQARALRAAIGRAQPIGIMINDLSWIGASKAPEARLAAVHWQGGVMAVEVRGDQAPFPAADRHLERAAHALRAGVWLWGIGPKLGPGERPGSTTQVGP
jgi:hypothetical protein